ncbi:hypothetical protein BD770DRAFT_391718 [Pilaira anomala]|nr:hypothetical protein BD770DRAFT_391718 [Pilaira anomala]
MGKSAKFYKRPSKKEKEGLAIKKVVEPVISKKKKNTINVPAAMVQDKAKPKKIVVLEEETMELDEVITKPAPKEQKPEKEQELPDYVDLFSGKKTYKRIPAKRK